MTGRADIVVHVGAPKTGSTYLQRRMRANVAVLREAGIYVPILREVERTAGNAKLLATSLGGASASFVRAYPELLERPLEPAAIARDLLREWERGRETLVLSAENFLPEHAAAVRTFLPQDARIVVVLFVRRQDVWIESYWNQLIKSADIATDLSSFAAVLCEPGAGPLCRPDWNAHYRAWNAAFTCRVVPFEDARSDLWGAFAAAAGFAFPEDSTEIEPAQVSLDAYELAYLRTLDPALPFETFVRRRDAGAVASREFGASPRIRFLSDADRALVRERFEASNAELRAVLGWPSDPFSFSAAVPPYLSLEALYATDGYRAFRRCADRIFERSLG